MGLFIEGRFLGRPDEICFALEWERGLEDLKVRGMVEGFKKIMSTAEGILGTLIFCPFYGPSERKQFEVRIMLTEFNGIEKRLDELNERLARLQPLRDKSRDAFDQDAYLRDETVF